MIVKAAVRRRTYVLARSGRIVTAGIANALAGAQEIGVICQALDRIERVGVGVVPGISDDLAGR